MRPRARLLKNKQLYFHNVWTIRYIFNLFSWRVVISLCNPVFVDGGVLQFKSARTLQRDIKAECGKSKRFEWCCGATVCCSQNKRNWFELIHKLIEVICELTLTTNFEYSQPIFLLLLNTHLRRSRQRYCSAWEKSEKMQPWIRILTSSPYFVLYPFFLCSFSTA